ncbi:MAG: hypothetical protein AAB363_04660 [Planctomycetota bacterium]
MPASFEDQLAVVAELLREVGRMEEGEKRHSKQPSRDGYERDLRLAGLAQRIAQSYTIIEGVLAYVARRIDRAPVAGEDWHKKLIARCATAYDDPKRLAVVSGALAEDLLELCEFRHVIRNIYPTRLEALRVRENLRRLVRATRAFDTEAKTFAAGLSPARRSGRKQSRR